ncbi:Phenazine biosynthesis protein, PhzF family [Aphelenchoides besseyi]|nr:Phenazine biosynthesis protein, PhzF family [Aphelenchoides besseyi]
MSDTPFFTVDAFTSQPFLGNPAAVCVFKTDDEPSDEVKQQLAIEFNLSETAFPIPKANELQHTAKRWSLRWFTPTNEVPLCGHATLATAHVIFNELGNTNDELEFETLSGLLTVRRQSDGYLQLDFPRFKITILNTSSQFEGLFPMETDVDGVAKSIAELLTVNLTPAIGLAYSSESKKLIVIIDPKTTRSQFLTIQPRSSELLRVNPTAEFVRGVIVAFAVNNPQAQGFDEDVDYVLRYFAPWNGIEEDPATGSAQCAAAPFFARLLKKQTLKGFQCYPKRGAKFLVDLNGDPKRLKISGRAVLIFRGHICSQVFQ